MDLNIFIDNIQNSCDEFLSKNLNEVLTQLKQNKTPVGRNFGEFKISPIGKKSYGVYVFYIKPRQPILKFEELSSLWETNQQNEKLTSPRTIKNRFTPLNAGQTACLYVGKSEDLQKRISQHVHQKTKASTYGLKLSEHDRLHNISTFEYSYFVLKTSPPDTQKDAMQCLLVTLEKHLRKELRPLIGKQ